MNPNATALKTRKSMKTTTWQPQCVRNQIMKDLLAGALADLGQLPDQDRRPGGTRLVELGP